MSIMVNQALDAVMYQATFPGLLQSNLVKTFKDGGLNFVTKIRMLY
jgi:hypothetical protein